MDPVNFRRNTYTQSDLKLFKKCEEIYSLFILTFLIKADQPNFSLVSISSFASTELRNAYDQMWIQDKCLKLTQPLDIKTKVINKQAKKL